MSNQNKASKIEYCETCGTMLVMGICRRCNPELTRTNKAGRVMKIYGTNSIKSDSDVMEVHETGVNHVAKVLLDNGIKSIITGNRSISLILNNGKTILVRAKSTDGRLALINTDLDYIKSDFIIVVSNLNYTTQKIYVIPSKDAKQIAVDYPRSNGESEFVISLNDYNEYQNNYNILKE